MMMPRRPIAVGHGLRLLLALVLLLPAPAALAQTDWSREVLATRDKDRKEALACVSIMRHGVSAEVIASLTRRELHTPVVALAAGQYFEKGELDQNTPAVLRALAARRDISAKAIAFASLSPSARELIVGLSASDDAADRLIAARMLAATAVMRSPDDRQKKRLAEKVAGKSQQLSINYRAQMVALLEACDPKKEALALEYTLFAVGYDRIVFARDAAAKHAGSMDPAVAMAAQYALASVGGEIDRPAILAQIKSDIVKVKPRRVRQEEPDTALTYDPRGTPHVYAIMAAGRAKMTGATDALIGLLVNDDLHIAVTAARSLGQIGGDGLPARLLEAMDEQTPWPVRIALYDAIGANPDAAVLDPLLERFMQERGRLRQDALYAMLSIAAGKPGGLNFEAFDLWWAQHKEAFKADQAATRAWRAEHKVGEIEVEPIAGFYDSAVISDRPVFAVDASKSMQGQQIESLQKMLGDVVLTLPEDVKFNIVDFGGHVRVLVNNKLIPADKRRQAMHRFKYDMELTLGTRSFDAIEQAMLIPEMDSVHFLSDGAPAGSQLKGWGKMNYITRLLCRTQPVAVHMVFFPEPGRAAQAAKSQNAKLMGFYARANAGRFVVSTAD